MKGEVKMKEITCFNAEGSYYCKYFAFFQAGGSEVNPYSYLYCDFLNKEVQKVMQ